MGFTLLPKTSAMSLAPKIRVNGIAPGPTIKNQRQSEKHFKKQYLATPLRKTGKCRMRFVILLTFLLKIYLLLDK